VCLELAISAAAASSSVAHIPAAAAASSSSSAHSKPLTAKQKQELELKQQFDQWTSKLQDVPLRRTDCKFGAATKLRPHPNCIL
jgi:hypothetical protein